LLDITGLRPSQKTWVFLGEALRDYLGRQNAYSPSYFSAAWNGSKDISGTPFETNMELLVDSLEARTMRKATYLLAVPAGLIVFPGSMVGESSRMCSEEGCSNFFIPNHPRRTRCYECSPPSHLRTYIMARRKAAN
jgi:hypothetical protein